MIKAVIFDFDGVLVESLDIKTNAFGKLFECEGKDFAERVMKYHIDNSGVSRYEKIRYIYKEMLSKNLDETIFADLCQRFSDLVAGEVIKAPYVTGAIEFLEEYAKEYSFFICSATPLEELKKIVLKRNMAQFFETIYGAPVKKTDIVMSILKKNQFTEKEVVYIGDALSDYNAAKGNGVHFVGRRTSDKIDLFDKVSCPVIDDLKELYDEIKAINIVSD